MTPAEARPGCLTESAKWRRLFDIAGAMALLVVSLPLLVAIAVGVKLDTPGPILHRDRRIGRGGRAFTMYKFRSMASKSARKRSEVLSTHADETHPFMVRNDPRVTRFGRLLRRTSLDELPQVYNVLRGDMSLVGPRPLLKNETARIAERCPLWMERRRQVLPGITGPWQIRVRQEPGATLEQMIRDDIRYVEERSASGDLRILLRTALAVLRGRGTT